MHGNTEYQDALKCYRRISSGIRFKPIVCWKSIQNMLKIIQLPENEWRE